MEQLTLDFEYVINEVIRHDATWGHQFCSFSDYDIVILEVGPGVEQGRQAQGLSALGITLKVMHPLSPRCAQKPTRSLSILACCFWRSHHQLRRASFGEWAGIPPSPLSSSESHSDPSVRES